jgi:tetratricopeptide (TPR) repeat protein
MLKQNLGLVAGALGLVTIVGFGLRPQAVVAQPNPPAQTSLDDAVQKLVERGLEKAGNKDYKGSIADFTQAIKLTPNAAILYYYRAATKEYAGDLKGAIADLTQSLKIEPTNRFYNYTRAFTRESAGDFKGAIADLTLYLETVPPGEGATTYGKRAGLYQQIGNHAKAIPDWTMEIKLQTGTISADLMRSRADSYIALGNKAAAIKDLNAAIAIYQTAGSDFDPIRQSTMENLAKLK